MQPTGVKFLIVLPLLTKSNFVILKAVIDGFAKTKSLYNSGVEEKLAFDRLQLSHQCCGATSFMDWFNESLPADWAAENSSITREPHNHW